MQAKKWPDPIELQQRTISDFLSRDPSHLRRSDVLVFVPVYNEEKTIADIIAKVRGACDFDLLIVDDSSTDSVPDILKKLDVNVLTHPVNFESRITSGIEIGYRLGYKHVIKMDGDGQHNPLDIIRLYDHAIKTGADIVIGSRYLKVFTAKKLSVKGSGMWFCAKLVSFISRKRITDTTSGFKIWSRRACKLALNSFRKGKLRISSTYHVEELMIAAKNKLKLEEIAVVMNSREYGESKAYSKKRMISFPLNLIGSTIRAIL